MAKETKDKTLQIIPGEAVGIVAAQSIGEPGTQMSLDSSEKVIVKINDEFKTVPIGEFVDHLMSKYGSKTVNHSELVIIPGNQSISVPSLDQDGTVKWKRLVECSRHKTSKKLLKLTTRSGRTITATENHSFVVRKIGKILPISGKELSIGSRIPVVRNLSFNGIINLDISFYLPKDEYWYGSELKKATEGKDFSVPVGSDQLRNHFNTKHSFDIEDGFVYPYQTHSKSKIPEFIQLDNLFGWFIGAYLSEGHATKYHIGLSNTDESFLSHARQFAKRFNLTYNEYDNYRGFSRGHDLRINSTVLSDFIQKTCFVGSANKKVPEYALSANLDFVSGLLRAYFEGDGNVSVDRRVIRVNSISKELLDGIAILLNRLGIFASKLRNKKDYSLSISYRYAQIFKEQIGFDSKEKKQALENLCKLNENKGKSYDSIDMVSGFGLLLYNIANELSLSTRLINNFTKKQAIGRTALLRYIEKFEHIAEQKNIDIKNEMLILRKLYHEDVTWDEIVSIEHVPSRNEYVYDFSVDGLETFTTFEGIITHNTMRTFHYAGVAEQVPTGLPRLIEIVDARRTPKKPMMDVHLDKDHAKDEKKAAIIAAEIEEISLSKIATIEEDFSKKLIHIKLDKKLVSEQRVNLEDLRAKIKTSGTERVELNGTTFTIKPKGDTLRTTRRVTTKLKDLRLKGIKGISRSVVLKEKGELFIRTGGTNLVEVLAWTGVDSSRCYTNDIKEIEKVLGIEAARNAIVREVKQVLDMQNLDVDIRHIMLLADAMCMDGDVKSVGRHGLSGEKAGILARAAFEETIKHLITAAVKGEVDKLIGVTENIIIGQIVPLGTGLVKLKMKRLDKLIQAKSE